MNADIRSVVVRLFVPESATLEIEAAIPSSICYEKVRCPHPKELVAYCISLSVDNDRYEEIQDLLERMILDKRVEVRIMWAVNMYAKISSFTVEGRDLELLKYYGDAMNASIVYIDMESLFH